MKNFSYVDERLQKKGDINGKLSARDMADMKRTSQSGLNDHGMNLQRLAMERGNMFGADSRKDFETDDMGRPVMKGKKSNKFGEITGGDFDDDVNLRGLPMRSQFTSRRSQYDNDDKNKFGGTFDLYDEKPSTLNVSYYDQAGNGTAGFCGINESTSKLSSQVHPTNIVGEKIDRINNNIFYSLFDIMRASAYIVNGVGLFNLFASLYLASDGITEVDLQKFFNFARKDILHEGMGITTKRLNSLSGMIDYKNFMFIGHDVPYNPKFLTMLKPYCTVVQLNINDPVGESTKANVMIKKMFNVNIRNPLTSENVDQLQLMFLSVSVINPVWAQPWDSIIPGIFQGINDDKKVQYMKAVNKSFGYFEDDTHQLIEARCYGDELAMGFLNYKYEFVPDVNDNDLHAMIQHMKNSMLPEVVIPTFQYDLKLRLNNTLKNMGLQSPFMKISARKLFPEGIVLQDVMQNVRIIVDNSHKSSRNNYSGYKTNARVVLNKPFIFYFRLLKTNTIIAMGTFQ